MKPEDIEELRKRVERLEAHNEKLLKELAAETRISKLLVIAGHLDIDRLEQATELAGGLFVESAYR